MRCYLLLPNCALAVPVERSKLTSAQPFALSVTLWVSVVDRNANIFGINHFHLTHRGWGRFEALYVIDGVLQQYGNKYPIPQAADKGPWSDGLLSYEVVKPLEEIPN